MVRMSFVLHDEASGRMLVVCETWAKAVKEVGGAWWLLAAISGAAAGFQGLCFCASLDTAYEVYTVVEQGSHTGLVGWL